MICIWFWDFGFRVVDKFHTVIINRFGEQELVHRKMTVISWSLAVKKCSRFYMAPLTRTTAECRYVLLLLLTSAVSLGVDEVRFGNYSRF